MRTLVDPEVLKPAGMKFVVAGWRGRDHRPQLVQAFSSRRERFDGRIDQNGVRHVLMLSAYNLCVRRALGSGSILLNHW